MPNPKKILDTLGSKDLSRSLGSLMAVWEEQGKSKEEIEQMLKDIEKREKTQNKEMKKWEDIIKANEKKIKANKKKIGANDLKIKQLQEARAHSY